MRFIFIASDLQTGGVTSAMRNLCNELILHGHSIDILDLPSAGRLPDGFSPDIRLIPIKGFVKFWNLGMHTVSRVNGLRKIAYLLLGAVKKLCNRGNLWNRIVFSGLSLADTYDVAVGFRQSPVCYWLAAKKCDARLSIGFWHTDPAFENVTALESCMKYPDKIACVSNAVTKQMKDKYPQYAEKFGTVYNLFDAKGIREACGESSPYYDRNEFIIVTVSRIEKTPKRIDAIPKICKLLANKTKASFHWYIVGNGPDKEAIEHEIIDTGTESLITLTGEQSNPYPYMRYADLFVLCSAWESYGMVIVESLITGTPVVAGDYPALHEILTDGKDGIVSENDPAAIADAIAELLNDNKKYQKIKAGAENYRYSSEQAYRQLIDMICGNDEIQRNRARI